MRDTYNDSVCTELLADALQGTIAELRLVDAGDLIAFIRTNRWANIADLVDSSAELSLRPGALSFACSASFMLDWDKTPAIGLDLEFQAIGLSVFFALMLGRRHSIIEVKSFCFAVAPIDPDEGTRLFANALAAARLPSTVPSRTFVPRR